MAEKRSFKWILAATLLLALSIGSNADGPVSQKVIKGEPIVIKTEAQHYQNPTLGEYQLCTQSRDDCIDKCGSYDKECRNTCPICPILIDRDVLVQGINDTLYRLPVTSSKVNQTNIIRLTNEIRNIIETSLGNITANSQNNINVYQNRSSRTGGKFGLGYTERGPCCHLLDSKRCKRSADGPVCSHQRQRTCGSHCISRVVRAKRVVSCSETNPDDCNRTMEYMPQYRRPGCRYISEYPFISCKSANTAVTKKPSCSACFNIPYVRVMRGQVPRACRSCYGRLSSRPAQQPYVPYQQSYQPYYYGEYPVRQPYRPYQPYQPYHPPPAMDTQYYGNGWTILDDDLVDDQMPDPANGWELEETKCINEDGSIKENCPAETGSEEDLPPAASFDGDEYDGSDTVDGWDYDYGEEEPPRRRATRYRRNKH